MKKLEQILEQKEIDEQAKNLLQGIIYKIEVSYKDYKKVKGKNKTEKKYVEDLIENISKRCDKIKVVKLSQKLADEEIQKELENKKFYVGNEIVSYPIEEKFLYAIEKKSNHKKILNNKYEEITIALSDLINTGKNLDRVEVLRDFNGWSWTTIKNEIENIEANLIYQTLQIVLGEEFLDNWCEDKDGIVDYLELFVQEISKKYGEKIAEKQKELLLKLAVANTIRENKEFAQYILEKKQKIDEQIKKYENTEEKIIEITNNKKELLKKLSQIEQILGQNTKLKEEFEKINEQAIMGQQIFSIKALKNKLNTEKQELLEQIEKANYLLNPSNFLKEKEKLEEQQKRLKSTELTQKETEKILIQFIQGFLKCLKTLIKNTTEQEEIIRLIYQLRYFMLLPFNQEKYVKDIQILQNDIIEVEKELTRKAIETKVIVDIPFEIITHVFETRIIILEELYYKITSEEGKYYVQIFDENVSEEEFEITEIGKAKVNKKIKIFI